MVGEITYLTREAPAHWRAALREIDPIRDATSYLEFAWYVPAQRWVLYNMVPMHSYPPEDQTTFWAEVNGPDPKYLPEHETFLSSVQWHLWQTHGRIAEPFWVIQGSHGGHLVRYNSEQQMIAKAAGLPGQPPAPGDLPYAGWDARVERQLKRLNLLRQARGDLDAFMRQNTGEGLRARKRDAAKAYRAEVARWLSDSQTEAMDHYLRAYKNNELPVTGSMDAPDWEREEEKAVANYIETGTTGGFADVKTT